MNPQPKIKRIKNAKYLSFIRQQPCCVCHSTLDIHAHHENLGYGIMGGKVNDTRAIPMCFKCHKDRHDGNLSSWQFFHSPERLIIEYLERFIAQC